MSSKIIDCLLIVGFVYVAHCAQFTTEPYEHPDHPGHCYDEATKEPVPVGEIRSNSFGCSWQQCKPDFSFFVTTCAPSFAPAGCTVSAPDFSKPYPKCCPQPICKSD